MASHEDRQMRADRMFRGQLDSRTGQSVLVGILTSQYAQEDAITLKKAAYDKEKARLADFVNSNKKVGPAPIPKSTTPVRQVEGRPAWGSPKGKGVQSPPRKAAQGQLPKQPQWVYEAIQAKEARRRGDNH